MVGKILWNLGLDVGTRADGTPIPPCPDPCGLESIAAITFTEKAAYDLKRKLREELDASAEGRALRWEVDRASVGTIHGFCAELLRDHALRLDIEPTFRVLDERESRLRQDEILRELLMERLRAGHRGTVDLVKRFTLYGYEHTDGALDQVRCVVRDLRWRAPRYREWREGDEGALEPETLTDLARRAGAWDDGGDRTYDGGEGEAGTDREGDGGPGTGRDGASHDRRVLEQVSVLHDLARDGLHRWLTWLERENARDFDSLVLDVRRLLTRRATRPALESIRRRYRLLVIDEFQDTDAAQRDIAFAIADLGTTPTAGEDSGADVPGKELSGGPAGTSGGEGDPGPSGAEAPRPQLFLVGDAKQSVYRFRGADITVWNEVKETLCGRREPLHLTHNFRSEPAVVRLVNRVGGHAMEERARALEALAPGSRVRYRALEPWREDRATGGVEWLAVDEGVKADERREIEGRRVAARIRELVDGATRVVDPDTEEVRACRFRDVAVLARTRNGLGCVEEALREYEIPAYNAATSGLSGRQEVTDLVTALRLLCDPHDDLRAFGYLRSPFVGLRDEVLARIRLDEATGRTSLLREAERWAAALEGGEVEAFPAPESDRVDAVEREALRRGLDAIRETRPLVDRVPHAELLDTVLRKTGYRLHLLLRDSSREATANLERFLGLLDEYRHLPLGSFLELWDRWGDQDLGIPQAPLYSGEDDVVTLSTIHGAKGLEWPVVFLVSLQEGPGSTAGQLTYGYWSDPDLGPVLMPKKADRGPRCERIFERAVLEDDAEEARLLYVAATRARDRLVLVGPTEEEKGYAGWLRVALEDAVEAREVEEPAATLPGAETSQRRRVPDPSRARDEATGTGPQIDAFGFHDEPEDGSGQFSLFAARGRDVAADREPAGPDETGNGAGSDVASRRVVVRRSFSSVQTRLREPPVALWWLDGLEPGDAPALVRPVGVGRRSFVTSATEIRMKAADSREWELRYVHGVEPVWRFAPRASGEEPGDSSPAGRKEGTEARETDGAQPPPPTVRGRIIHGVLERIEEEAEMARILDETLSGIDDADVEELLQPGNRYREALEREIRRVVRSPEWAWYVSPPHDAERHRELPFVHLIGPEEWRVGAFDLYRPARGGGGGAGREPEDGGSEPTGPPPPASLFDAPPAEAAERDRTPWVVDFKTHRIEPGAVESTARAYDVQVRVYREAAEAVLGGPVRVALHFTLPNVAVER